MQKKIIGVVGSGLSSLACISRLLNDPEVSIVIIDDSKDDNLDINSNLKLPWNTFDITSELLGATTFNEILFLVMVGTEAGYKIE